MEITGKLFKKMQEQTGEGKNGPWTKCDFVIDVEEKFPKKVCFSAWGDLVKTIQLINEGAEIKVSFDVSSREFKEKWYSDIKAWKVEIIGENPPAPGPVDSEPKTFLTPVTDQESEGEGGLPF